MRAATPILSLFVPLCCMLTGCGAQSARQSAMLERALQTSAPATAAKDALLTAELNGKLVAADFDSAGSVSASVSKGIATLRGTARTEPEIAHLSDAAAEVPGIASVVTLVKVDPKFRGSAEKLQDVSLATHVAVSLAEQAGVNALAVRTRARDGVVVLEGKVSSRAVRSVMVSAAAKTHGVKKVVDKLKVLRAM